MFLLLFVIIVSACNNSSSEESGTKVDNPSQKKDHNAADSSETASYPDDTTNPDNHVTDENVDTSNNVPEKSKDTSHNDATLSQKEMYLKKFSDTKREMDELRRNPEDESTYAMKKVEGDRYDSWDGLLNEIYGVLKEQLPQDEMDQLRKEQRNWIQNRDDAAKEASLKYEGGTMEQLEYVAVLANLTEERCYELVVEYMH